MMMYYVAPLYMGWRIWWANRLPIMDCDEVFNYWEPLHFILYNEGFQTWEYSNEFSLRTYAYLQPLAGLSRLLQMIIPYLPAWLWPLLSEAQTTFIVAIHDTEVSPMATLGDDKKVELFLLLRATLAGTMAAAELSFCRAMVQHGTEMEHLVSWITGILLLFSAGMSHSAGALLPSSTITLLWLLASTSFLHSRHIWFALFAILATLAIGWPFGVLMFVPIALVVLWREHLNLWIFLSKVSAIAVAVQIVVMFVDKEYYGKWVSSTWNILIYNTQSGGDELYGIEPLSYYVKNLALNFNYVGAAGIAALPIVGLIRRHATSSSLLVLLLPMHVWLAVVLPRPHKEERFLFPIYPALCLGAALLSVTMVDAAYRRFYRRSMKWRFAIWVQAAIWLPAVLISTSRTVALSKYYSAPLQVYSQLRYHPDVTDTVICTCGEWYRFPSSFYLPSSIQSFGFVESSFQGQLPQPYRSYGSRTPHEFDASHFNNQNRPEQQSYTPLEQCEYLIDLHSSKDCRETNSNWKPLAFSAFLHTEGTISTMHRTLYIPLWHEKEEEHGSVQYVDYILYQRMVD